MNINEILKGIDCGCGKRHDCPIDYVYVERDAAKRFTELCRDYKKIIIVADENTYRAGGEAVCAALRGKDIVKVIFSGASVLIPDEAAIARVREDIEGAELIIGIGSGVIQDLCKYLSHFEKIPYMVYATAPSMDGYASTGAAMILGGMKETVAAGLPRAIIADTACLKDAPMEMIKAGYGDIIGKYSALCDWKLSALVNGEYFCDYIYGITYKMIETTIENAPKLLSRDEESIKALFEALVIVGIMMSFAGSSRPASGSEHHLSHFFEIVGILNGEEYFPHGIDVAYSTVITARIREALAGKPFPKKLFRLPEEECRRTVEKIYTTSAPGCIALQEKVGAYRRNLLPIYLEREDEIKDILREVPSGEEIERLLKLVDMDIKEFYELYGEEKIERAVAYAKDLKDRYTVLWLNYDLFGGEVK